MGSKSPQPRDGLSLYLHDVSRDRLAMLAGALSISKTAVVAQAISRWVLHVARQRESRWHWYVEHPFREEARARRKKRTTTKIYARLPESVIRQVEAFADALHVPLSAVVEQALLRWCREDPLVKSEGNGQATSRVRESLEEA
jgi:predicted transcriptional regulator